MPIFEAYPRNKRGLIQEYQRINQEVFLHGQKVQRHISSGERRIVTPMSMQLKPNHSFWGCEYEVVVHDDELQTGRVRMKANSAFSWGVVYMPDRQEFVRVIGSHTYFLGPNSPVFPIVRVTQEGDVIEKLIIWRPQRRDN